MKFNNSIIYKVESVARPEAGKKEALEPQANSLTKIQISESLHHELLTTTSNVGQQLLLRH